MSKIADLYIRVSTDEQAEKGYSQRNQEEVLRRYCALNSILIRNVIYEDHSAKTFNRPEWKKLLINLKKYKNKIDLVLFTKWDRFSRNTGDAYQMISILRKLGVEPQAIEQPLDLSVPENKMMLAFYLSIPEVENDRRALNVFHGMRRAKKEGRCMGRPPMGYINRTKEDGSKYVQAVESITSIIRWAFEEIARGVFNTETIYKMARKKGLPCLLNNFWFMIRNPFYCGKLFIPKYKDEESFFVKGLHEPIISETLFYQVQDILDGRGREYRPKFETTLEFPLRGFLVCPICGKALTGSKSKGRSRYYHYYHCYGHCNFRVKSNDVHKAFDKELNKYIPRKECMNLYASIIIEKYNEVTDIQQFEKKRLISEIKDFQSRLSISRNLLGKGEIDGADFREMKSTYVEKIEKLEAKLYTLNNEIPNVEALLDEGISRLLKLSYIGKFYEDDKNKILKEELPEIRDLIGSIFPQKISYDNGAVRTGRLNEVVNCIYMMNNELDKNKSWTSDFKINLSSKVA